NDPDPGNDAAAGLEWLESNEPGGNPDAPIANLYEVDVAWVRQPNSSEAVAALLVTAVGTGGWHQLTSWQVPATGIPAEVSTTPPIDGHHPKLKKLEPDAILPETAKKFVTARIRDNGDLWLSTRS